MPTATYTVQIDWDNNSSYAGTGEDVTARVRTTPPVVFSRGKDQIRSLAPPMAGRCDFDLNNQSKDYSPENSTGPLYGNLVPGRKVRIRTTYSSTTLTQWTGFLDDIPQHPQAGEKTVSIPCLGSLSRLKGKKVSTSLYSSITTDVALGHLLDAVGWPAGDRVLSTGKTTLAWWWLDQEDAFDAAVTLLNTEGPGAVLYEDGQGRIVFEDRQYRPTTTRSNTSQATLADADGSEPRIYGEGFSYNPGLKDIVNVAEMTVKSRSAAATGVVWSLGETVILGAGQTRKYLANASNPFQSALEPVENTDYTVSAGSLSSVSLNRTSGANVTITLTAGASGATITGLQLRADSVDVDNTIIVGNTVDASASITNYGRQVWADATRAEIAVGTAQDLVNAIVGLYKEPRPTASVILTNGTAARFAQALTREISDRVTITENQTGINHGYYIEHIRHEIRDGGTIHHTQFGCEKVTGVEYFILDTSQLDTGVMGF